jgi:putative DNA primase/helicase
MLSNRELKIKTELSSKTKKFLDHFQKKLYTYIPDNNPALPVMTSEILDLSRQESGYGVFFSINGFSDGKRDSSHLVCLNAVFCDIDYPDKQNKTPEKIREYKNAIAMELMDEDILPTATVETKNGLHLYWIFVTPLFLDSYNEQQRKDLLETYRKLEEAILARFEGDPAAKDTSRVLRVPETLHQKDPNDPFECKLTFYNDENLYTFDNLCKKFLVPEPQDNWAVANSDNSLDAKDKEEIEKLYPKLSRPSYQRLLNQSAIIPEGSRNRALLVVASACALGGWTQDKTLSHFVEFYGLSTREIRKTILSAYRNPYDFGTKNEVMQIVMDSKEHEEISRVASKVIGKKHQQERTQDKESQKEMYETYEMIIAERYPGLKYKLDGDFYEYTGGVYKQVSLESIRSFVLREMFADGLKNYRKVSSVADKLACFKSLPFKSFSHADENPNPNILNLKNGLLDMETYTLTPHTPDYLSTVQVPIDFDENARCPLWFKFLNEIMDGDQEQISLLQQIAGYCLTNETKYQKGFIFLGHQGGNGKGVFTRTISKIIGRENVSNLKLTTLTKQFGLASIINKRLNVVDEISGNYFESDVIKGLISGDPLEAEVKFKAETINFIPITKILFTINELPKINDTSEALYRRIIIVMFDKVFQAAPDNDLDEKLEAEKAGILNWMIDGLKKLRENGKFVVYEKNLKAIHGFKEKNSPLVEFVTTFYEPVGANDKNKYKTEMREIYNAYKNFCIDNGYKSKSMSNFSHELFNSVIEGYSIEKETSPARDVYVVGFRPINNFNGEKIRY